MVTEFTIGVDPDSDKHGVALYEGERLTALYSFTLLEFRDFLLGFFGDNFDGLLVFIEDNVKVGAAYTAQRGESLKVKLNIAQKIGRVKQAQIEVERMLEELSIDMKHCQQSKRWKKGKVEIDMFKRATGWEGRSNEDTRSASWFGWHGARERNLMKAVRK